MAIPPPSDLDFGQCIQGAYDDTSGRIRVDAELTSTIIAPPGLEVAISDVDDSIKIGNGSGTYAQITVANALKVDGSAVTQPISAIALPLPTGASTALNQTNGAQKTQTVDGAGNVWGPRTGSGGVNWFPIINLEAATDGSAVALRTLQIGGSDGTNIRTISTDSTGKLNINNISGSVSLPTGAATSANQTTEIASLASIDSKLTSPLTINPITFASSQHVIVDSGAITSNIGTTGGLALDTTVSGLLTDTQLRATPVPISGTVAVSNFPAIQPVSQSGTWDINSVVNPISLTFQIGSDIFTTTGNGSTLNASSGPLKTFSLQVDITGTVTIWDVRLEGSLDNINFTQILQHTNTTGNGITLYSGSVLSPSLYIRTRCAGFTGLGGSSLNAIILGVQ